ncbi:beta-galactosidase [Auraticoccus sp. F435]|uniref:beta-galactosidase n=1 Tax=Auraticoccus cholistanensis TaxID=2656650 RepID=A0A6A9UPP7_9ACTN|nr:beta-galactosidase [Auraticoccus cholistanensis]MVA74693.1 beta-galactosidase [Auraticoccus cholistanensis]
MTPSSRPPIGFGAAYYAEYQPVPRLAEDMRLMREAGFSVIRVGESTWSTWEPSDGVFATDWMREVLDAAEQHGIGVVLGTPTYAVPPWLARKHPEIAGEPRTGQPLRWGARQEVDLTAPAFREHAERIIRLVTGTFADHPAVQGYQVDNEPGLLLLHNEHVVARFRRWLAERFSSVEELNERWGLVYWSHRLTSFDELWAPDHNAQPQYDLAWRLFQTELVDEFIGWQADLVREVARPDQFVTTCIAYDRPATDDLRLSERLDISSGNAYYRMRDALAHPSPTVPQSWMTSGTWSVFLSADRMFASRGAPFLVTETNAGPIHASNVNEPGYDGQWRQVAWAMVARGARLIEYWHWHTAHFGTETHWVGVLPHDLQPGRVYRNVAALGREIEQLGPVVAGTRPDSQVGLLFSTPSKFALAFEPVFGDEPRAVSGRSYQRIVESFYRGAFGAGLQTRVLHDRALPSGAELAAELPVLVAAGLYVAADAVLDVLVDYVAAGGHLVLGPRSAYADEWACARTEVKPARLAELAGLRYQEFVTLDQPVPLRSGASDWPAGAAATGWMELLEPAGAEVLAGYDHPELGAFAAVTSQPAGAGRITVVGTVLDDEAVTALFRRIAAEQALPVLDTGGATSVTHASATAEDGRSRIHFVFNWSGQPVRVPCPQGWRDLTGPAGPFLELGRWDVRILEEPLC